MNKDFSRIITLLRKERGLSQKQTAADLNISQALLSHYEKGIRECGLDFVVKTADYYGVSCDYLLGRTPERTGATLNINDIPEAGDARQEARATGNLLPTLNKKLIINSVDILFDILDRTACRGLTTEISNYLMVSVYKMFRTVYSANAKNPQALFSVAPHLYKGFSNAALCIAETNAAAIAAGRSTADFDGLGKESAPTLTPETIAAQFPLYTTSLLNLIQTAESKLHLKNK
ncbi:MAG TPA: helix-turn-helix transcriptional regulator [Candidatus Scatavimonas merdigallinarum]|uniref:Helix-turn-helix transcriptional regulator n=1 Tax=Candidatus Scatavimonas merdigallinarum TaxID=2840914 RepID=A0A9D1CTR3_9FIRM|nr:helix-turn-helix transcriptional regulator [Candidatus Scatavimonas merdigallinarum]